MTRVHLAARQRSTLNPRPNISSTELKVVKCESEAEETARTQHVAYFELYKKCLMEEDVTQLESLWTDLDVLWMGIK